MILNDPRLTFDPINRIEGLKQMYELHECTMYHKKANYYYISENQDFYPMVSNAPRLTFDHMNGI